MKRTMRCILQRVSEASVTVDGQVVGQIGSGLLVLLGVGKSDGTADADFLVEKIKHFRVFADESGKMNRSAVDVNAEILIVSQFTLYGNTDRGRRPSFESAAPPVLAETLYRYFVRAMQASGLFVAEGKFQAHMDVRLVNQGPITFWLESSHS